MARTRVVVGFSGPDSDTGLSTVYVGRSGAEMEAAMKASTVHRFEIFEGMGRRKNNPNYIAPGPDLPETEAASDLEPETEAEPEPEPESSGKSKKK